MPHSRDRRPGSGGPRSAVGSQAIGAALYRWRSAPEPTGRCGGRSRSPCAVRSGGSRVHSPPSSPRFPPTTGSLCRRSTGTRPVHSPLFVMSAEYVSGDRERQARCARLLALTRGRRAPTPRTAGLAGSGSAGSGDPSRTARRGGTWNRDDFRRSASGGTCHTTPAAAPSRHGGEGGIRTHEVFRLCAFQERRLQPLGHLSAAEGSSQRRDHPP